MERCGAFSEAIVFLHHFAGLGDPRQHGKVRYRLDEVLLLCLLAVLAGAETNTDIARLGEKKRAPLRRFRPFADGTPSHDQLGTILTSLDAEEFQRCFVAWVATVTGAPAEVIRFPVVEIASREGLGDPLPGWSRSVSEASELSIRNDRAAAPDAAASEAARAISPQPAPTGSGS